MFSKALRRAVASLLVLSLLGGCAEIDRRGGLVDQIEDAVFFKADTKSHRLLRSYLLATILLTAARRQGHNDVDRTAIAGALEGALAVANEAYVCLYPKTYKAVGTLPKTQAGNTIYPLSAPYLAPASDTPPGEIVDYAPGKNYAVATQYDRPVICQFFDEKMARLDYALYRLAEVTLFNEGSRQRLGDIRSRLVGKIPVLSDAAVAAVHANKALNQVTTILDDLLNLAFNSFGPLLALLPLYRDSLELNMWVIADNLRLQCNPSAAPTNIDAAIESTTLSNPCASFAYAMRILKRGNGDLKVWRHFTEQMNEQLRAEDVLPFEAYRPHFLLVTQLLVRSCRNVLSDGASPARCETVLGNALELAAFNMDNATGVNTENRQFLASLPLPGAQYILTASRRKRATDPQATGSIARTPNAQQPAPAQASPAPAPTTSSPAAPAR